MVLPAGFGQRSAECTLMTGVIGWVDGDVRLEDYTANAFRVRVGAHDGIAYPGSNRDQESIPKSRLGRVLHPELAIIRPQSGTAHKTHYLSIERGRLEWKEWSACGRFHLFPIQGMSDLAAGSLLLG